MWEISARASRLEGELASHQKKLEAIEKRGRALRAEIGRKVEELAEEESRTLRDCSRERERVKELERRLAEANHTWERAHQAAVQTSQSHAGAEAVRQAFEAVGASRARAQTLQEVIGEHQHAVQRKEGAAADLRRQIDELRAQLQRYSEALENDLAAGRDRIATRVREALGYEKAFSETSTKLMRHLRDRPECQELVEELRIEEAKFRGNHESVVAMPRNSQLVKA